jgi:DNA-3-methyladenine glycosylase II
VEAFAEPWKGWRAYATFYLWRYLSSEAERG